MKRIITALFAVLLISSAAFTQDDDKKSDSMPHPMMSGTISTSIDGPKFEMVARLEGITTPFRLNKETGEVWYLRPGTLLSYRGGRFGMPVRAVTEY